MLQQFDKLRFTIFELIRKPRKRGYAWTAGKENIAPGMGIVIICIILIWSSTRAISYGLYKYAALYEAAEKVLDIAISN